MLAKCDYDVILVGGGPAGLTAGLYTTRAQLKTLLIEQETIGGTITSAERVENFPGFPDGISGSKIGANIVSQALQFGLEFKRTEVTGIEVRDNLKWVNTTEDEYSATVLIIASGTRPKKLPGSVTENIDDIGVSYCALCDGHSFRDQDVAVIGGGDSGITEGLYLTRLASKVTVIEMLPKLNATQILCERAQRNPKMEILCSTVVETIDTEDGIKNLTLKNVETGVKTNLKVAGVFILIGRIPNTAYLKDLVDFDSQRWIIVNNDMETSVPGIFAAGDIRSGSVGQAITAAADGATAALAAEKFITLPPK